MVTCGEGANSNGVQEVKLETMYIKETVAENPYCTDLGPVLRHDTSNKLTYVECDPYLMKISEFSTETKVLPTIRAVGITNYLVPQTSNFTNSDDR